MHDSQNHTVPGVLTIKLEHLVEVVQLVKRQRDLRQKFMARGHLHCSEREFLEGQQAVEAAEDVLLIAAGSPVQRPANAEVVEAAAVMLTWSVRVDLVEFNLLTPGELVLWWLEEVNRSGLSKEQIVDVLREVLGPAVMRTSLGKVVP